MNVYVSRLLLLGWGSLPVVLLSLPAHFFDEGQSLCLSVLFLKTECWGCGLTRATMHLIHLDFYTAYEFNKGSFVIFPLLVYLWWQVLSKLYDSSNQNTK